MAKIEPEKRASLTEVKKGKDVTELKFKMSINGEYCPESPEKVEVSSS